MFLAGCLLAVLSGLANTGAAGLQKREGLTVAGNPGPLRLLLTLIRRPWWCAALLVSVVAWVAEAAALVLAPLAAVAPLRSAGKSLLVGVGIRWLGETFDRAELLGVVLALGGAGLAAATAVPVAVHQPLGNLTLLAVGGTALGAALALALLARAPGYGAAVGILFTATAIYTKEIGDRFAHEGLHLATLVALLETPDIWGLIALSAVAQGLLQRAFREVNAASVAAANAAVSTVGLVLAGVVLYGQPFPRGLAAAGLSLAIALATVGALLVARAAPPAVVD